MEDPEKPFPVYLNFRSSDRKCIAWE